MVSQVVVRGCLVLPVEEATDILSTLVPTALEARLTGREKEMEELKKEKAGRRLTSVAT